MQKEEERLKESQEKFELDEEQLRVLYDEYCQNLAREEIRDQEDKELISEYQKKHCLSRNDAILRIARDRLEY